MDNQVILLLNGDKIEITNALIGARMNDRDDTPFSVYAGVMDIGELGLSLLHILRAVTKISVGELGLSRRMAEDFILFTLKEAIKLETENKQRFTVNRDTQSFIKKYMDNQY